MVTTDITFIFGLGSRYSYLAACRIPRFEDLAGQSFDWRPVSSPRLIRQARGGVSPFEGPLYGQYAPDWRHEDAARWAALYGVPYAGQKPMSLGEDDLALACWSIDDRDARQDFAIWLMAEIHGAGRRFDLPSLRAAAADHGGPSDDDWPEAARDAHDAALAFALARKAFGVPTLLTPDAAFWGNDRLPLFEDWLNRRVETEQGARK